MNKRANSYDVARMAGVSRSVVSLVVNGKADQYRISKDSQRRVVEAIRKTGYTPNMMIRNLFLQQTELMGVSGPVATLPEVITPALNAAGMSIDVTTLPDEKKSAIKHIDALLEQGQAVLILPPPFPNNGKKDKPGKTPSNEHPSKEAPLTFAPARPHPTPRKDKPDGKPFNEKGQRDKHKKHGNETPPPRSVNDS